jgi:hypothetical protein
MPRRGKREGAGRKKGVPDQKKMGSQVTRPVLGRTFEGEIVTGRSDEVRPANR